jgi:hypothetical protein
MSSRKLTLDLHPIFNKGGELDAALVRVALARDEPLPG